METAVVTGAAGFIGCHLVERLVEHGWAVRGIDDLRSGDWGRVTVPIEQVERDLVSLDSDELISLLRGADALFHLAAEKHNSSRVTPQRTIDVNVSATRRLFEAAARAGVGRVVFASSVYVYTIGGRPLAETDLPEPTTVYGLTKVAGEHLLRVAARDHGLSWTVARVFFVYGPRQYAEGGYKSVIVKNYERIRRGERPVVFGDGEQALDYVYVDNCVDALLAMVSLEHEGCTYNVASGRAMTVNELTRLMLGAAGSDLKPLPGPADWTAGTVRIGAPELANRRLGWRATTPIEEGLARVWRWLEEQS